MDLEVALLIAAAVVGIVVGILHLVGYVPPRYRRMLASVQHDTAQAITDALDAKLDEIGPRIAAPMENAATRVSEAVGGLSSMLQEQAKLAEEYAKQIPNLENIPPEITGALGGNATQANRLARELKAAVGQSVLGPYGALLEQFAPPLYDFLQEHPEMAETALQMPIVQKAINWGQKQLGSVREKINESGGWG